MERVAERPVRDGWFLRWISGRVTFFELLVEAYLSQQHALAVFTDGNSVCYDSPVLVGAAEGALGAGGGRVSAGWLRPFTPYNHLCFCSTTTSFCGRRRRRIPIGLFSRPRCWWRFIPHLRSLFDTTPARRRHRGTVGSHCAAGRPCGGGPAGRRGGGGAVCRGGGVGARHAIRAVCRGGGVGARHAIRRRGAFFDAPPLLRRAAPVRIGPSLIGRLILRNSIQVCLKNRVINQQIQRSSPRNRSCRPRNGTYC